MLCHAGITFIIILIQVWSVYESTGEFYQEHKQMFMHSDDYVLEEVGVVGEPEERHGVCEHPDVAAAAVVVRLAPLAVLIAHAQDVVGHSLRVRRLVVRVRVVPCTEM
jgi:hypothetical protein